MRRIVLLRQALLPLAAFLLSAGTVWASGGGEHGSGVLLKDFLYRVLNFAVTFGLLAYFVTKPIRKGLAGRRTGIAEALEQSEQARTEAEARAAGYADKLAKASQEIDEIAASIRREGELERAAILENARRLAEQVKADAAKKAELEVAKARAELQEEAARLAVSLAREMLEKQINAADHKRLADESIQKIGEYH